MEFLHKYDENPFLDLAWNTPEQKQGAVNIIGGNSMNFRTPVKVAEHLSANYPIKTVNLVLPDALKTKLPTLENFLFLSSTDSGSFGSAEELKTAIDSADDSLLIGDLSKNNITRAAVATAVTEAEKPVILTRDAVDLIAEEASDKLLANQNLVFMASIPQLQKLFRAVYYPKMLMMSQSLVQVAEALHKFTLSYPTQIITLHNGQVLVAKNGNVHTGILSGYTPLTFWMGEAAAKILANNLFNPNNFEKATIFSLL